MSFLWPQIRWFFVTLLCISSRVDEFESKVCLQLCYIHNYVQILRRFWHNTCLFFDRRKGDVCDFVMYIIARKIYVLGYYCPNKRLATHMPFFRDFWGVYNMTFCILFVQAKCVMFETELYVWSRYVYTMLHI